MSETRKDGGESQSPAPGALRTFGRMTLGRGLTRGELNECLWMFGTTFGFSVTRVFAHNFWAPFPNRRVMTPDGNIYYHRSDYREDFSLRSVPIQARALFMHEATHLYQKYVLGWHLMMSGPFNREYAYEIKPGKKLWAYNVEEMASIVEDFYLLRHGFRKRSLTYTVADYAHLLPVRGEDSVPIAIRW